MKNIFDKILKLFTELFVNIYIPKINIFDILEIVIIITILYFLLKSLKNTRTWVVIKGMLFFGVFYVISYLFSFNVILKIFESALLVLTIAIVVIFASDIRKYLENIGSKNFVKKLKNIFKKEKEGNLISEKTISEIVDACLLMSKAKTGAIIVCEKSIPLNDFINTGISMDSEISKQLILNIFENNTPLHDGAVIIRNNRITSATCYLPLSTNKNINKKFGTRHRAAIGISENTDALAIIVSEETGGISIAKNGKIKSVSKDDLIRELLSFQSDSVIKDKNIKRAFSKNLALKISSVIIGFVVWFLMINSANPIIDNTFQSIPITYINDSAFIENNKTYTVLSEETAMVVVSGHRGDVEKIKSEDIEVIADLSKLSEINTIKLQAKCNNPNISVEVKEEIITLSIEDFVKKSFKPTILPIGEENDYCYIHTITPASEEFSVKGANSLIQTIERIEFNPDITGVHKDTEITAVPIIYDKNGRKMDMSKLNLESEKMTFYIETYKTKSVKINYSVKYENNMEQYVKSTNIETEQIRVAGKEYVLDYISSIYIDIPLTITEKDLLEDGLTKEIKISDYTDGEYIIPQKYDIVNIKIEFEDSVERRFNIKFEDLKLIDNTNSYSVQKYSDTVEFSLIGNRKEVFTITKENLQLGLNLSGVKKGYKELPLSITLPDGIVLKKEKKIPVYIK